VFDFSTIFSFTEILMPQANNKAQHTFCSTWKQGNSELLHSISLLDSKILQWWHAGRNLDFPDIYMHQVNSELHRYAPAQCHTTAGNCLQIFPHHGYTDFDTLQNSYSILILQIQWYILTLCKGPSTISSSSSHSIWRHSPIHPQNFVHFFSPQ